jgi:[ribosomal protein S5]-alanine N-acetyltransferase
MYATSHMNNTSSSDVGWSLSGAATAAAQRRIDHIIETESLYMRPVCSSDAQLYAELFSDARVMRFIGLEQGKTLTAAETVNIVDRSVAVWQERGYGRWTILNRYTYEFIGFCGFRCEEGEPELISAIHERHWGTGIAKEAAEACLEYGFSTLSFTSVKAFCRPDHGRARGLMAKLGGQYLGLTDFHGVTGAAYNVLPSITMS